MRCFLDNFNKILTFESSLLELLLIWRARARVSALACKSLLHGGAPIKIAFGLELTAAGNENQGALNYSTESAWANGTIFSGEVLIMRARSTRKLNAGSFLSSRSCCLYIIIDHETHKEFWIVSAEYEDAYGNGCEESQLYFKTHSNAKNGW